MAFVAAICLCVLSRLEHQKSIRPSAIICTFALLTSLFDAAQVRTMWLSGDATTLASVLTASLSAKISILIIESRSQPLALNVKENKPRSPEETNGVFSRALLTWLVNLLIFGYRHPLKLDDLYPLDTKLGSSQVNSIFIYHWHNVTSCESNYFANV